MFTCYNKGVKHEVKKKGRPRLSNKMPEAARAKAAARSKVQYAIFMGRLKRLPCRVCGDKQSEAHHRDHSKPLKVVWLCKSHHSRVHIRT